MRLLSTFIQDLFAQAALTGERSFRSQVGVSMTLSNGSIYNVGTGEFNISSISYKGSSIDITPIVFEARAMELPNFRHSQGQSPDAGEIALMNMDWLISALIPEPTRLFENAKATVYICFPKPDGSYEGVVYFKGLIRGLSGDDDLAPLSLISDLSAKTATIAEEITQRCLNELGDYITGGRCGATHLPGGATCSKDFYDEVNGCMFWGQMHAFWGIPFINPTGLINGYAGPGGGGWDEPPIGTGGCIDPDMFVKRDSGIWTLGRDLEPGDRTIDSRGRIGEVEATRMKRVDYRYLTECSNGAKLKHSADHPLTTAFDDDDGRQAYSLHPYVDFLNGDIDQPDRILCEAKGEVKLDERWTMTPMPGGMVLQIAMKDGGSKNYVAGITPEYGIESHNKPIYGRPGLE